VKLQRKKRAHELFLHIMAAFIETLVPAFDRITRAIAEEVRVQPHQPRAALAVTFLE
jgi:hypothetical protein